MTFIELLTKRWYVFIIILGFIILLLNLSSIFSLFGGESFSTVGLYELNESVIPQGTSFSLTEDDFKEFPQLASIVRDKRQNPMQTFDDGKRFYIIPLTEDEMYKFNNRYWVNRSGEMRRIFEYSGKYFEFTIPVIH